MVDTQCHDITYSIFRIVFLFTRPDDYGNFDIWFFLGLTQRCPGQRWVINTEDTK